MTKNYFEHVCHVFHGEFFEAVKTKGYLTYTPDQGIVVALMSATWGDGTSVNDDEIIDGLTQEIIAHFTQGDCRGKVRNGSYED